jgi:hypothetical protein
MSIPGILGALRDMPQVVKILIFLAIIAISYWALWGAGGAFLQDDEKRVSNISNQISIGPVGHGSTVTINPTPASPTAAKVELRQEIRALLESINPDILKLADSGAREIRVMIGNKNQNRLASLSEREGFSKYLSYALTGDNIGGGIGNKIGGYIYDVSQGEAMNGCVLTVKDVLRR